MGVLADILKSATQGRTHVPQHAVRAPVVEAPKRYRKEHPFAGYIDFQGLPIDVENLKGSAREGVDKDGHAWKVTMGAHYGELPGAAAQDGDYLDVYVGPDADSPLVVVVHQLDPETGKADEDKCLLGWRTAREAVAFYRSQYTKPGFYGGHDAMSIGRFRRLAMDPARRGRMIKGRAGSLAGLLKGALTDASELWIELPEAYGAALYGRLAKGAGHRYIRRTGSPGHYRYWYSEASTAHAAKEGERINLKHQGVHEVVKVHDNGKVQLRHTGTGEERTVHVSELHKEIHAVYGSAMDRGAERTVKAVLAKVGHVDTTPAGLVKAYRDRFAKLGVSTAHAEALLRFVASRKGWHDDAKRTLAELSATKQNVRRVRTIASGAEALARADKASEVAAKHVAKAAALPTGPALDDVRSKVATMAGKLEASLGAVEAVGEHAPHRRAMVDYAHTVATSPAMSELEAVVAAFPAMATAPEFQRMRALQEKVRELAGGAPAKDDGKGIRGAETVVFVADAAGNPTPQTARYRLIEAGEAVASHDPTQGFKRNTAYPEGVQERAYHSDKEHQDVVRTNARKLQPALVINTNPDAVNGPPLMSKDGIVLGGNSRTMAVQIAHEEGGAASSAYVKHLTTNAATFGFTAADVAKMKRPMLVREVDTPGADKKALGVLVRRYNESYTQGMDPRVDQVARARLVTPGMLDTLGTAMSEKASSGDDRYPTLSAYLDSPRAKQLIEEMGHAGIIDRRNRAVYLRENGTLNEDGKTFVERLLVGKVLPDPDLLGEMKPSQVTAIARSTPQIVRAASHGHDLAPHLADALQASVYMDRSGLKSVDELDMDQGLGDFAARSGDAGGWGEKPKLGPEAKALLRIVREKPGAVQMAAAFREIAQHATRNPAGQGDLAGAAKSTADILGMVAGGEREDRQGGLFRGGRLATLLKGALYIGPRGGKYGNAAHTEPYREDTDRAIGETAAKKAERAAKVERATGTVLAAHAVWQRAIKDCKGGPESDHTCRKAWQGLYDALDHLGRAMHLDVHDGGDWAEAAAARLRSQGHKVSLRFASGHGPSPEEAKKQMDMFKGRRLLATLLKSACDTPKLTPAEAKAVLLTRIDSRLRWMCQPPSSDANAPTPTCDGDDTDAEIADRLTDDIIGELSYGPQSIAGVRAIGGIEKLRDVVLRRIPAMRAKLAADATKRPGRGPLSSMLQMARVA